jgi:hypothetical protein
MGRSTLRTLFYLALVFVSGAMVGTFADRLYMLKTVNASTSGEQHRMKMRKQYTEELHARLHLDDSQMAQLQTIMDSTGKQLQDLRKAIEEEHAQKILAILNDSQKAEYAKLRAERDQRRTQEKR